MDCLLQKTLIKRKEGSFMTTNFSSQYRQLAILLYELVDWAEKFVQMITDFICISDHFDPAESIGDKVDVHWQKALTCCATSNRFPWITRHFSNLTKDTLFDAKNFSSLHVRTLIALGTVTAFHSPHLEGDRWWVTGGRWWTIFPKTLFYSNMERKTEKSCHTV